MDTLWDILDHASGRRRHVKPAVLVSLTNPSSCIRSVSVSETIYMVMSLVARRCLALAPAGAWVAITGEISSNSWYPDLLIVSLGVMIWIAAFDLGYAQMDIESDKKTGVNSFPARFQPPTTMAVMLLSIPIWAAAFSVVSPIGTLISLVLVVSVLVASGSQFQTWWFRAHVSTGWVLLAAMQLS